MSIILLEPEKQLSIHKPKRTRNRTTYYDTIYHSLIYMTKVTYPLTISIVTPHVNLHSILIKKRLIDKVDPDKITVMRKGDRPDIPHYVISLKGMKYIEKYEELRKVLTDGLGDY